MIRFLRWLFTGDGHAHKWKQIEKVNVYGDAKDSMPMGSKYILQCEICGDIKKVST